MNPFEKAKWIWYSSSNLFDDYGEFYESFDYNDGKAELYILADSNYAVYLNGVLCACGQYADYPHDKVYDKIDITNKVRQGNNSLAITVWYYGSSQPSVYYPGMAGVCFEVKLDDSAIVYSSKETPSRQSRTYECHKEKILTPQLGFSFHYDATLEDGWMSGELGGFSKSCEFDLNAPLRERPIKRLDTNSFKEATLVKVLENNHLLYDLGINTVGLLEIEACAESKALITVSYGEHIADGCVRRLIGARDFSVEVTVGKELVAYTNPFRRLGARYLEIESDTPININKIGIRETNYPLNSLPRPTLTKAENEIYDICERTLRLCMHEHYEDCPWREQALYAMDSRNQMLCGYYAFGEFDFPKACLRLIAADNREDGLISICAPTAKDMVIPSFSLHYFTACAEYLAYSRDKEFIRSVYPKLSSILDVFLNRGARDGKLLPPFEGTAYWNFYEWTKWLSRVSDGPDLILNTLLSIALQKMAYIATELGYIDCYSEISHKLNEEIKAAFYDGELHIFRDRNETVTYSVLGNALAILAGVTTKEESEIIAEKLCGDDALVPISLSMRCFLNDALLKVDKEKYAPKILSDIEHIYRPMVDMGIGTVWETELGESDFRNAGSLCHGWSALPIYYYHILKGNA